MTKTKPKAQTVRIRRTGGSVEAIPLSKLVLSPKNVRQNAKQALRPTRNFNASILHKGLKQKPARPQSWCENFHVHAGGLSGKPLQKLKRCHIKSGHPVPCHIGEDQGFRPRTPQLRETDSAGRHARSDQFRGLCVQIAQPMGGRRIRSRPVWHRRD